MGAHDNQPGYMPSTQMSETDPAVSTVRSFWNTEPCGSHFVPEVWGTARFYQQYREFRYRTEWHIPLHIPLDEIRGKKVLEIGCGNGADGTLFAAAGADYLGVDLTKAAVESAGRHFQS